MGSHLLTDVTPYSLPDDVEVLGKPAVAIDSCDKYAESLNKALPTSSPNGALREAQRLMCCCGCCCLLGFLIGILVAVFWVRSVEEYAICRANVCGYDGGSTPIAHYVSFEIDDMEGMSSPECAAALESQAGPESDFKVYVTAWFNNPNNFVVDVTSLKVEFVRTDVSPAATIANCLLDGESKLQPGDMTMQLQCIIVASMKSNAAAFLSDYLDCKEVTIRQVFSFEATILGFIPTGLVIVPGETATIHNKNSIECSNGVPETTTPDWLTGPTGCNGTTDIGIELPTVFLCSVWVSSLSALLDMTMSVELDVYNPSPFSISLSSANLSILSGASLDSLVATVSVGGDTEVAIGPNSTEAIVLTATIESLSALAQLAYEQNVLVTGDISASMLGINFITLSVPPTTVRITTAESTGTSIWSEATNGLLNYMSGNCHCIYSCSNEAIMTASTDQCASATGGSCTFSSCDASRNAFCWSNECICRDTECAVDGACVAKNQSIAEETSSTCSRDTGGTCNIGSCSTSRSAICQDGKCICREGECAAEGACVAF